MLVMPKRRQIATIAADYEQAAPLNRASNTRLSAGQRVMAAIGFSGTIISTTRRIGAARSDSDQSTKESVLEHTQTRESCKKGKIIGQKRPLTP